MKGKMAPWPVNAGAVGGPLVGDADAAGGMIVGVADIDGRQVPATGANMGGGHRVARSPGTRAKWGERDAEPDSRSTAGRASRPVDDTAETRLAMARAPQGRERAAPSLPPGTYPLPRPAAQWMSNEATPYQREPDRLGTQHAGTERAAGAVKRISGVAMTRA